jgi:hypothetical protein
MDQWKIGGGTHLLPDRSRPASGFRANIAANRHRILNDPGATRGTLLGAHKPNNRDPRHKAVATRP